MSFSNSRCPVPAGIKWPQITFSFIPSSLSILPLIAASFKTFVVSWKEAADIKLDVCKAARVIPWRIWVEVAATASRTSTGFKSRRFNILFSSRNLRAVTICPACIFWESPASTTTFLPQIRSFSSMNSSLSTTCCSRKRVSPGSSICTLRIIWRTIISKCLSLIFTPCKRYTSWTSFTIYSCTAVGPLIAKISAGVVAPSDNGVPART